MTRSLTLTDTTEMVYYLVYRYLSQATPEPTDSSRRLLGKFSIERKYLPCCIFQLGYKSRSLKSVEKFIVGPSARSC